MATVTGLTAERMIAMENATVIDGNVVGNNLILQTRDGTNIDTGNVRGPMGPGGSGFQICTSTTRPTLLVADEGKAIYETDTNLIRVWTGTRWQVQQTIVCTSTTRPTMVSADEGVLIYETDTDLVRFWNGVRWKLQERIVCTSTTRPAGLVTADEGVKIYETDTNLEYIWSGSAWVLVTPGLYVPYSIALSAQAGTPTIGNAVVGARYSIIGKQVHAIMTFILGTTTNFGSGALFVSLPVPISSVGAYAEFTLGVGHCQDSSSGDRHPLIAVQTSTTNVFLMAANSIAVTGAPSSNPIPWTTGDRLSYNVHYETD